jgi:FtsP/CotA-like multicopper oxidase with cupredoxin domain
MSTTSRRSFIGAGAAVATGLGLRRGACAQPALPASPPAARAATAPQPQARRSEGGVLDTTLRAVPATVDMGAAKPVTTWTYDGIVPGYTWEVVPGDTLRIDLVNDLPPLHETEPVDMTRPHAWTTTNLHTHGLHVSPKGNSDNVFLHIPPGQSNQYEIAIPNDHPAGFFWYHPHKHGGVAQQVRAGMAGGIIVRGDIDEVEEIRAATEQTLILQAIELGDDFQLLDPIPHPSASQAFYPRTQILYTVNGVMTPTIRMYPGEVQRWRLLNAAEGKFMSLRLEEHELHQIAWDGLTLHEPEPATDLMLAAANRVEVLVKAGKPGRYHLVLTPGSSQHPGIPGMAHATPEPGNQDSSELKTRPILTLEVGGSGPEMSLPTDLPAFDPDILPIAKQREFVYSVERGANNEFFTFGVNGTPFDPNNPPYRATLDTAEEWTLFNGIDGKLPHHAHGFHIHVNPFKVTKINGEPVDRPFWRDTFALSGQSADSITFVMNFLDFDGMFVDHCHVLAHEDLGMMEAIEVSR